MTAKEKCFQYYKVYGLRIKSEVIMEQLITITDCKDEEIDVVIKYGKMPDEVYNNEMQTGRYYSFAKDKMWIKVDGIATYYIADGSSIIIEPIGEYSSEMLKNFLLGLICWMLFIQRGEIALHGASIIKNEHRAITVLGDSGAGKSTLTSTLLQRGYKLIADDLSVVAVEDHSVKVKPGYPQQKLTGKIMRQLGYRTEEYKITNKARDKYAIPNREQFVEENQRLGIIYELKAGDVEEVQYQEILGFEKVLILMKYIGTKEVLYHVGLEKVYLGKCIELAKHLRIVQLTRPQDKMTVNEQIAIVNSF